MYFTIAPMKVGPVIRRARKASGINQPELAFRCGWGYNQGRISHYETGKRKPDFDDVVAIASALDMTIVEMLDRYGEEKSRRLSKPSEIETALSALSPDEIDAWMTLLRPGARKPKGR